MQFPINYKAMNSKANAALTKHVLINQIVEIAFQLLEENGQVLLGHTMMFMHVDCSQIGKILSSNANGNMTGKVYNSSTDLTMD